MIQLQRCRDIFFSSFENDLLHFKPEWESDIFSGRSWIQNTVLVPYQMQAHVLSHQTHCRGGGRAGSLTHRQNRLHCLFRVWLNPNPVFDKAQILSLMNIYFVQIFKKWLVLGGKNKTWNSCERGGYLCSACLCWRDRKTIVEWKGELTQWARLRHFINNTEILQNK